MRIKRILLLICVLCFSIMATGCGEPLYEMTDDEEAIITAYASKTVSKFNKNQSTGICNVRVKTGELDLDYVPDEELEESDNPDEMIDSENPDDGTIDETDLDNEQDLDSAEGDTQELEDETSGGQSGYSITDAVGIDGVEFSCSSFDVSDVYQTNAFATSKVNGKKYVILHIDAQNVSNSSIDFSSYGDRSYQLSIDGTKADTVYVPVSNNLDTYDGVLKANDSKSFVLVFLFSDSSLDNMSSLELFVTSDGTTRGTTI